MEKLPNFCGRTNGLLVELIGQLISIRARLEAVTLTQVALASPTDPKVLKKIQTAQNVVLASSSKEAREAQKRIRTILKGNAPTK